MDQGWGEVDFHSGFASCTTLNWPQERVHAVSDGKIHIENHMFAAKTTVLSSTSHSWKTFLESGPKAVSVDAKMLDCREAETKYPVMILVASNTHVIVEFPEENAYDPCLSAELKSFLENKSITKVFFDGTHTLLTSLRCDCQPTIDINGMFYTRITSEESIESAVEHGVVGMLSALKRKKFVKQQLLKRRTFLVNASNFRNDASLILAAAADAWCILVCYNALRRMPVADEEAIVPYSAINNHINDFLNDNM